MLFSLLKHYLDTDTALKVSQSVYCFTTSISHGVENYFPRLWGTGSSDAIFLRIYFCHEIPVNIRNVFKWFKHLQNYLHPILWFSKCFQVNVYAVMFKKCFINILCTNVFTENVY